MPVVLYLYLLGFAGMMAIIFVAFAPLRNHPELREHLLSWTIGAVLVSALWPLVLIAALVAATDQ